MKFSSTKDIVSLFLLLWRCLFVKTKNRNKIGKTNRRIHNASLNSNAKIGNKNRRYFHSFPFRDRKGFFYFLFHIQGMSRSFVLELLFLLCVCVCVLILICGIRDWCGAWTFQYDAKVTKKTRISSARFMNMSESS